jgi:hypothetical protein
VMERATAPRSAVVNGAATASSSATSPVENDGSSAARHSSRKRPAAEPVAEDHGGDVADAVAGQQLAVHEAGGTVARGGLVERRHGGRHGRPAVHLAGVLQPDLPWQLGKPGHLRERAVPTASRGREQPGVRAVRSAGSRRSSTRRRSVRSSRSAAHRRSTVSTRRWGLSGGRTAGRYAAGAACSTPASWDVRERCASLASRLPERGEAMTTLHIEHAISDFPTWYGAFQRFEEVRARSASCATASSSPSTTSSTSSWTSTSAPAPRPRRCWRSCARRCGRPPRAHRPWSEPPRRGSWSRAGCLSATALHLRRPAFVSRLRADRRGRTVAVLELRRHDAPLAAHRSAARSGVAGRCAHRRSRERHHQRDL